jgi:hypothetical protein
MRYPARPSTITGIRHVQPLVWRESGHLSEPDAGYALCCAPVRFEDELRTITREQACDACLLRAEQNGREFTRPLR